MNTMNIIDLRTSVIDYAKFNRMAHTQEYSGFYAGGGCGNWIKCADHESALNSKLRVIFFVKSDNATLYQS